jgi:hypothetical protein
MQTYDQLKNKLTVLCAMAAGVQEEAIRIMKELEQFSAPVPTRGKKTKGLLSQEEISKILAKRISKINL